MTTTSWPAAIGRFSEHDGGRRNSRLAADDDIFGRINVPENLYIQKDQFLGHCVATSIALPIFRGSCSVTTMFQMNNNPKLKHYALKLMLLHVRLSTANLRNASETLLNAVNSEQRNHFSKSPSDG